MLYIINLIVYFFLNDTQTTEIYTLSLHDALPISHLASIQATACRHPSGLGFAARSRVEDYWFGWRDSRSEEHTSELQSQSNIVCRLVLEKKKKKEKDWSHCSEVYGD